MGPGAAYAHIAMSQAIADAGLGEDDIVNERTGLVAGSGGPSTSAMLDAHQTVLKTAKIIKRFTRKRKALLRHRPQDCISQTVYLKE